MSVRIKVSDNKDFCYDIVIEHDFLKLRQELIRLGYSGRRACIITDSNVNDLYVESVIREIKDLFSFVSTYVFPAGEENKNITTVTGIYEHLILNKYDRKDVLLALGGGVTGDITGYVAATYLRGIDFIQIPTTLLAQVDSSIGGKTGIDFLQYKNMVGAFYQPKLVYMNLSTSKSLPPIEFSCGMGEVIKHALIKDNSYFEWIMHNKDQIQDRHLNTLENMIEKSCLIKKNVVEQDPKELGERALLNFGHTVGHAVEKLMNYHIHHGQCVGLGYLAAAYISYKRNLITMEDLNAIKVANIAFNIPEYLNNINPYEIVSATKLDKKMENGIIKFILLKNIGNAYIDYTVTDDELIEAISYINKEGKQNE